MKDIEEIKSHSDENLILACNLMGSKLLEEGAGGETKKFSFPSEKMTYKIVF